MPAVVKSAAVGCPAPPANNPQSAGVAEEGPIAPPDGSFFIARLDGRPVGCGALLRVDAAIGEIKRLWTHPSARGIGVARRIIATIETAARRAGVAALRLDTNRALKEAQALYRGCGYVEVAAFNDEPYAHHWFEKSLK